MTKSAPRICRLTLARSTWLAAVLCARGTLAQPAELEVDAEVEAESPPPTEEDVGPATGASERATEVERLRALVERLESRLTTIETAAVPANERSEATPDDERTEGEGAPSSSRHWWDVLDLRVSGYLQAQVSTNQFSEDEFSPDGAALNQDRFIIRRGRIRIDRTWQYASTAFEIDASTTRGPFMGVRRAEASFFYPSSTPGVPYVGGTIGLTEVPFGFELRTSNRVRWFLERSAGSLAFQRGEPDVGVRTYGGVGVFRYAFAVMNGSPLDDRPGGETVDPTRAKDLVGRVGVERTEHPRFRFRAGLSFQHGTGLHHGTPATKPTVLWRDTNEDGVIQTVELTGVPGRAATPSQHFRRWGVNADVGLDVHSPIGWTQVMAEVTMATNLDRSFTVADPIATGYDLREFAWYVAVVQEITPYAVAGFRIDHYDPDADLLDARRGVRVPRDAGQTTFSPMMGGQLPGRGRLVLQYDRIRDHLGRNAAGIPVDLANDQFVARVQLEF